jgi:uncharacterized membrane protein
MNNRKIIHFGQAFAEGWNVFMKNAGMAIAGYFIIMGIATVAGYILCIGQVAWIFLLQFPFFGGLTLFYLNMVKGRKPEINDIFAGFRDFGRWLGVGWLYIAIFLISMIPLLVSGAVAGMLYYLRETALHSEPALANGLLAGMIISLVIGFVGSAAIWIVLLVRYFFAYYAAAEGAGVLEAFGRSAEMTRGVRFQLLLITILMTLFTAAGMLVFCMGQLFTALIAKMVYTAIYLDLKGQMEFPGGSSPS